MGKGKTATWVKLAAHNDSARETGLASFMPLRGCALRHASRVALNDTATSSPSLPLAPVTSEQSFPQLLFGLADASLTAQ